MIIQICHIVTRLDIGGMENGVEVHFDYLKIGNIDLSARAFKHADPHA